MKIKLIINYFIELVMLPITLANMARLLQLYQKVLENQLKCQQEAARILQRVLANQDYIIAVLEDAENVDIEITENSDTVWN